MRIVRSVSAMQRLALSWRRKAAKVGFVPTMGYLHEGHLSLARHARRLVGRTGFVVLSIYVNPTQFAPSEDLAQYPRDLTRDLALCRDAGVDVVFVPVDADVYPRPSGAEYSTYVVEEGLGGLMEGAARPTHFRGVTTVVAKLFNLVLPDVAVFGAKDFQQAAIIQRMVRDLNFPVKVVLAPTVREPDGLAMSSRNRYLSAEERPQAVILSRALTEARERVRARKGGLPAARLKAALVRLIATQPAARLDYLEFFDPQTLQPAEAVRRGTQMALAVYVGNTRLIDNATLS
jgi:pantoate--beta-alanine ligase